jgi:hypothetical protein
MKPPLRTGISRVFRSRGSVRLIGRFLAHLNAVCRDPGAGLRESGPRSLRAAPARPSAARRRRRPRVAEMCASTRNIVAAAGDSHLGLDRHRPRPAAQLGALRDRRARAQRVVRVDPRARSPCRRRRPSPTPRGGPSTTCRARRSPSASRSRDRRSRPRGRARRSNSASPSGDHSLCGARSGGANERSRASPGRAGATGSTSWHARCRSAASRARATATRAASRRREREPQAMAGANA